MIYKDAGKLLSDSPREQDCGHRRIHAAGERAKSPAVSNLFPDLPDGFFHKRPHLPVAAAAAHIIDKIAQHFLPLPGVHHLRVKLGRIEVSLRAFHGRHRTDRRMRRNAESLRRFGNVIRVAHPHGSGGLHIPEQHGRPVHFRHSMAVLTHRSRLHFSAQGVCH